ncbi:hypothetical protein RCG23_20750 [Neobacillus sp. PS3-34]|uniref:hypothetical protein n=1 Tax=Neobacillus sp. PS3-34 TaxID=3070678 RepID=UPI0027E11E09|nr:hypothetical protein [Neobacillus sp. PS3-34]WML47747.1 hypothetical protein RCG23_20750 [Neobacillus sp. PS3-34]
MKELVGLCSQCGKEVFCLDGFFSGIVTEDKKILCFECDEEIKKTRRLASL